MVGWLPWHMHQPTNHRFLKTVLVVILMLPTFVGCGRTPGPERAQGPPSAAPSSERLLAGWTKLADGYAETGRQAIAAEAAHQAELQAELQRQEAARQEQAKRASRSRQVVRASVSGGGDCTRPSTCPALRNCENGDAKGGVYAPGSSRTYYSAYQFDKSTWYSHNVAGGDWGNATPAQQDAAADHAYAERGSAPWPNCGRHLQ